MLEDPIPNEMFVGEAVTMTADLTESLGEEIISGTPTFAVSAGGPAASNVSTSGTRAQALFTATGIKPGVYSVLCTIAATGTPAQAIKLRGYVRVSQP